MPDQVRHDKWLSGLSNQQGQLLQFLEGLLQEDLGEVPELGFVDDALVAGEAGGDLHRAAFVAADEVVAT